MSVSAVRVNYEASPQTAPLSASGRWLRPAPVRVSVATDWDAVSGLAEKWCALVESLGSSNVFQTFEWHRSWWAAFGGDSELRLVLCHSGEKLVGIAPLMRTRAASRLGFTRYQLCFIGSLNRASDYCDFLVSPDAPHALEAMLTQIGDEMLEDCLHLSNVPEASPNFARIVRFIRECGMDAVMECDQPAPSRILGNRTEDRQVINKNSLKRHYNWFNRNGDLQFHRCRDATEILGYLDSFFDQHIARWKLAATDSQFEDLAQREFYRNLVITLQPKGWLAFDVVLYNGKPVAFHLGFTYQNRFIWYKPTFDPEFARRSPGEVLLRLLLQRAIDTGMEEFDFTVGDEAFKYRFANVIRYNRRIIIFGSRFSFLSYQLRAKLRSLVRGQSAVGAAAPVAGPAS